MPVAMEEMVPWLGWPGRFSGKKAGDELIRDESVGLGKVGKNAGRSSTDATAETSDIETESCVGERRGNSPLVIPERHQPARTLADGAAGWRLSLTMKLRVNVEHRGFAQGDDDLHHRLI